MFDTIGGLPVHPLVVHAAVVLIPLSAVGAFLIVLRPRYLRYFGVATVSVASIGLIASFIAKESGESLASRVGNPEPHVEYGDIYPILALGYVLVLIFFWLFARGVPLNRNRPLWLKCVGAVVLLAAVGISYFTVLVGHTGAEATWSGIIQNTQVGTFPSED